MDTDFEIEKSSTCPQAALGRIPSVQNHKTSQFYDTRRQFLIDIMAIRNHRNPMKTLGRDQV